jgi:starvation-inducible DNA-binding protein
MDRDRLTEQLQPLLVELTDLGLSAKQAHWNLRGPQFRPVHLELDELVDDVRNWADQVAERLVALDIPADGRVGTVGADSPFAEFPEGFVSVDKALAAVIERLDVVIVGVRDRIDQLGRVDLVSQDLLVGVASGLEKHRWMFAAQRQ